MKKTVEKKESSDIGKVKNFLVGLGFVCSSHPSAQHFIYSKDGETVIIKNNKNLRKLRG